MDDRNPIQAQFYRNTVTARMARETGCAPPLPLVLIHDGGGTTFGYFTLGSLERDVWGVHSPTFRTGEPFEGGMDAMARHYVDLIQKAGIKGKILLGGWSLGGYLSLTIAHLIACAPEDFEISISGLILMDSPWLLPGRKLDPSTPRADLSHLPPLVLKSLQNVHHMLFDWQLPQWGGAGGGDRTARFRVTGRNLEAPPGHVVYRTLGDEWKPIKYKNEYSNPVDSEAKETNGDAPAATNGDEPTANGEAAAAATNGDAAAAAAAAKPEPKLPPPPAVLFRSVDFCPSENKSEPAKRVRVDYFREEPLLGWDGNYNRDMIRAVIEARSHHYDIFNTKNSNEITKSVRDAIKILETFRLE